MFMTSLNYTCDVGYEASLGVTVQQSFCRQNNTWSALKNCTIISCPSFNVTNGNVTFTSLTYGSQAVVECEQGFWAENGQTSMSVTCQHKKTWTIEPTCAVDNLKKKQRRFLIKMSTIRNASGADKEVMARGRLDCATKCASDYYCRGANFRETSGSGGATGTCRLFLNDTDGSDLSTDPEWKYLEVM
ncbi:hypothetical protein DPMN_150878 [Dreissena polymorpha]|uniref:Sushi domain-containing protein n=2 Tax=Dreissena polymorpha TaxID=45954 RepID=A0A9D4J3R3_DREPO|nr:hypothetical protein DPMN_150878 [Dreissena polymorpha]